MIQATDNSMRLNLTSKKGHNSSGDILDFLVLHDTTHFALEHTVVILQTFKLIPAAGFNHVQQPSGVYGN